MHFGKILGLLSCLSINRALSQKCVPTSRDVEGPFFVDDAPAGPQIAPEAERSDPNSAVSLTGRVLDRNCRGISNALVEVWYAGGSIASYTFRPDILWYRGKTTTNESGRYVFEATFPGTYSGRPIPHYHFKVTGGRKELVTQAYFRDHVPRAYENYVLGRDSQFPTVRISREGRNVQFDLVMDV